jgi:hypothetical protein
MLRMAVVPRYRFPAPVKTPKTDEEWFDKYFQVMKPPKTTNTTSAVTNAPAGAP